MKPIGAILTYRNNGTIKPVEKTVGSDGSGDFAVVFRGKPEESSQAAYEYVKKLLDHAEYQDHIDGITIVSAYESYLGSHIQEIDVLNI